MVFSERIQIDQQHTGIYIAVGVYTQCDLRIVPEFGSVLHKLFRGGAKDVAAQVSIIELGNVAEYHQVTI